MNRVCKELLPKAIVATVNTCAKGSLARSRKIVKEDFTLRNVYTKNSLIMWASKYKPSRSIDKINAIVGTKSSYLPLQETGGVVRARRQRIPIPTTAARRGKTKAGVVAPDYRMSKIGRIGRGSKFFYMRLRKPGIFMRQGKAKRLIMIRDLSLRSYRIQPTKWHSRSTEYFKKRGTMERIFVHHAKRQLAKVR